MVDTSLLMTGDYIFNHRKWECPVTEIKKNEFGDVVSVIARHYEEETFPAENMDYIPLTVEFFEANGFVDFGHGQMAKPAPENDVMFSIVKNYEKMPGATAKFLICASRSYHEEKVPMNYVHEYQQMRRRFGLGTEVKFPKK